MKRLGRYIAWGLVLAVAGSAIALYILGRSGPDLMPWHTVKLTAEFTAEMADEVRSFSDYLQLEDRLFAQLEDKVYTRTGTGPEYELVRYSSGSAADPQLRSPNWNRSFEFSVDTPRGGVLLLHGMSDSPYSLRALGETLNGNDYWVIGLRMPGHGTAPSGLTSVKWQDMAAVVKLGMEHLASKVGQKEAGPHHRLFDRGPSCSGLRPQRSGGYERAGTGQPCANLAGDRHQSDGRAGQMEGKAVPPAGSGTVCLADNPA
jgi:hypothetical protein